MPQSFEMPFDLAQMSLGSCLVLTPVVVRMEDHTRRPQDALIEPNGLKLMDRITVEMRISVGEFWKAPDPKPCLPRGKEKVPGTIGMWPTSSRRCPDSTFGAWP